MQRDGSPDERTGASASGREPPVIEGQATEIHPRPNAMQDAADNQGRDDDAGPESLGEPVAEADAEDALVAPVASRKRSGAKLALIGVPAIILAGAVAWLAAPHAHRPSGLRAKIVALLPEPAQRMFRAAPKTDADNGVAQNEASSEKQQAAAPAPLASDNAASPPQPAQEAEKAPQPAAREQARQEPPVSPPPEAAPPSSEPAIAALAARVETLASRVETLTAAQSRSADLSAKLDDLSARLDAIEQKLAAPKSDHRATQSRENGETQPTQAPAARIVVAQELGRALAAGQPLKESVAALHALGVEDDRLAALSPYLDKGAPSVAQLAKQWAALRSKIVAGAPAAGGDWSERLLARAKGLVRVEPIGAQSGASSAAVYSRVEAALQRGDLAQALHESDSLQGAASTAAADWRAAANQRVNADAAAQAVVSDSLAALARTKS
ncbi:MAG: hypothetical protein KGM42_08865 [Hyphomicrobiales bacterium]|nr:hypothetical protein [Hyphomicrobiales bacterium]